MGMYKDVEAAGKVHQRTISRFQRRCWNGFQMNADESNIWRAITFTKKHQSSIIRILRHTDRTKVQNIAMEDKECIIHRSGFPMLPPSQEWELLDPQTGKAINNSMDVNWGLSGDRQ
jgi:hypothetical protein